jgi:putative ABC transport system substrate-binding protein
LADAVSGVADAQQPGAPRRIGVLETIPSHLNTKNLDGLRRGLRELGYIESQNYVLEYRSADGVAERYQVSPTNWCASAAT